MTADQPRHTRRLDNNKRPIIGVSFGSSNFVNVQPSRAVILRNCEKNNHCQYLYYYCVTPLRRQSFVNDTGLRDVCDNVTITIATMIYIEYYYVHERPGRPWTLKYLGRTLATFSILYWIAPRSDLAVSALLR